MDIEEAKEYLRNYKYDNEVKEAIETVLVELEKKDNIIKEMVRIDPHIYRMANIRLEEREGK